MAATLPALTDPAAIRERNLHALLAALLGSRTAARADLVIGTGLSKPTVASGLRTLEEAGLVREFGRTTGRRGPSASLYEIVPSGVCVLAVDLGAHYTRALIADLDGTTVDELTIALADPDFEHLLETVRKVRAWLDGHALECELAVVGSPGVVDPVTGRVGAAPNIHGWEGVLAEHVLTDAIGLPVLVENDVNLAALGELAEGGGRGVDSFAYLTVGTGLGAGLVLGGRLHRGARGAAGEVGYLPVGPDPFSSEAARVGGAMEERLSAHGLLELATALAATTPTRLAPPFELPAIFDAARAGDPLGRAVVATAARELAVCVAAISAVVDLDLVLVGGGIGSNHDVLLPEARAELGRLLPAAPRLEPAALGDHAVRHGAVSVGLQAATARVIRGLVVT